MTNKEFIDSSNELEQTKIITNFIRNSKSVSREELIKEFKEWLDKENN